MLPQFSLEDGSFNHKQAKGLSQILLGISNNCNLQNPQRKLIFKEFEDCKIRPSVKRYLEGCVLKAS